MKFKKSMFVILFLLLIGVSYSYYTNTGKLVAQFQSPDSFGGFNSERNFNEFIDGGCDLDSNGINDTMLDTLTGRCWMKDFSSGGTTMILATAMTYCDNSNYANQSDWTLPDVKELFSLFDTSSGYGNVDGKLRDLGFYGVVDTGYWSRTPVSLTTGYFFANVFKGEIQYAGVNSATPLNVVCVRKDY